MHIAFFDSGLGGLSILEELLCHPSAAALPLTQCSYIADTAAFPYGNKNDAWLAERIVSVIAKSLDSITPDLVVIACNTASTLALDQLRNRFKVPFVGVVPAVKPAAAISKTGIIGILATPATIARDYTAQLIANYAPNSTVILSGAGALVTQAENKVLGKPLDLLQIAQSLQNIFNDPKAKNLDTIVLACTHFPLLKAELIAASPRQVNWVDSGEAIARRVVQVLAPLGLPENLNSTQKRDINFQLLTTGGSLATAYQALLAPDYPRVTINETKKLFSSHAMLTI